MRTMQQYKRTIRGVKKIGMDLSIAQVKYAYKKLFGVKIDDGKGFLQAANIMYAQYGREKIEAALADYVADDYINGKYDC